MWGRVLCLLVLVSGCKPMEPLEFGDITVDELAGTRGVVRFTTSRPVKCRLELGSTADVLDRYFTDPELEPNALVTEHRIPVENLFPNTKYFFRARVTDELDVITATPLQEFRTPVAPVSRLKNVALTTEGTTVVSVSSSKSDAFSAVRALDDDFVTEWATNGEGDAARLELDLGQTRRLTAFAFRSRSRTDGTAIITRVGLSLDGAAEQVFDTPDHRQLYLFTLPAAVDARRVVVRAVASTGGDTGAKEVQLLMP